MHPVVGGGADRVVACAVGIFEMQAVRDHGAVVPLTGSRADETAPPAVQRGHPAGGHIAPFPFPVRHEAEFEHAVAVVEAADGPGLARTAEGGAQFDFERVAPHGGGQAEFKTIPTRYALLRARGYDKSKQQAQKEKRAAGGHR